MPAGVDQLLALSRFSLRFFTKVLETMVELAPESHSILTVFIDGLPSLVFRRPNVIGLNNGVLSLFGSRRL